MNKRTFLPLLALALCATMLLPLGNLLAGGSPENPTPKAEDFTLVDAEGQTHKLSDYAGNYVVIEWLNHGCPFVQKHYNSMNMQSLQKKYTAKGVIWLSIISSAPGKQGHSTPDAQIGSGPLPAYCSHAVGVLPQRERPNMRSGPSYGFSRVGRWECPPPAAAHSCEVDWRFQWRRTTTNQTATARRT